MTVSKEGISKQWRLCKLNGYDLLMPAKNSISWYR